MNKTSNTNHSGPQGHSAEFVQEKRRAQGMRMVPGGFSLQWPIRGGSAPKWVPFSGFRYMKW